LKFSYNVTDPKTGRLERKSQDWSRRETETGREWLLNRITGTNVKPKHMANEEKKLENKAQHQSSSRSTGGSSSSSNR
jgi:hypothetical protein